MGPGADQNGERDARTGTRPEAEGPADLYDLFEVAPEADLRELRSAYRRLARVFHPDVHQALSPPATGSAAGAFHGDAQLAMARINDAWSVLSDVARRAEYDRVRRQRNATANGSRARNGTTPGGGVSTGGTGDSGRRGGGGGPATFVRPAMPDGPRDPVVLTRKEAWLRGVGMRIRFLASYAGRSAVQTMLLRHPGTSRQSWEAIVPLICDRLTADVGERVRQARAAGAAPLDLANAATLLALHDYGEELVALGALAAHRLAGHPPKLAPEDLRCHGEMVDRMYDALAYELPRELVQQLGNAPRVLRRLPRR